MANSSDAAVKSRSLTIDETAMGSPRLSWVPSL